MEEKSKMTKRKWEFENEGEKTRKHIRPQLNIHPIRSCLHMPTIRKEYWTIIFA